MIILDHNIPEAEAEKLRRRRVHFRQIGFEVGRPEWDDQQEILRYLHETKQMTFFTRDMGFFRAPLRHANYCLVVLTVPVLETARYIQVAASSSFQHQGETQRESHKTFNTENKFLGDGAAATEHLQLVNERHRVPPFFCCSRHALTLPNHSVGPRQHVREF